MGENGAYTDCGLRLGPRATKLSESRMIQLLPKVCTLPDAFQGFMKMEDVSRYGEPLRHFDEDGRCLRQIA